MTKHIFVATCLIALSSTLPLKAQGGGRARDVFRNMDQMVVRIVNHNPIFGFDDQSLKAFAELQLRNNGLPVKELGVLQPTVKVTLTGTTNAMVTAFYLEVSVEAFANIPSLEWSDRASVWKYFYITINPGSPSQARPVIRQRLAGLLNILSNDYVSANP